MQELMERLSQLQATLSAKVVGQEEALSHLVQSLGAWLLRCSKEGVVTPFSALFVGPDLVGKGLTARVLAKDSGYFEGFKVVAMAQYTTLESATQLIGPEGELALFATRCPKGVIIFDEIEKSDVQVQVALAEFLWSENSPFGQMALLFATTLGRELYLSDDFWLQWRQGHLRAEMMLLEAIAKQQKMLYQTPQPMVAPELLTRLAEYPMIIFSRLSFAALEEIASAALRRTQEEIEAMGVACTLVRPELLTKALILSLSPYINAKQVVHNLSRLLLDPILAALRKNEEIVRVRVGAGRALAADLGKFRGSEEELSRLRRHLITPKWQVRVVEGELRLSLSRLLAEPLGRPDEGVTLEYAASGFAGVAGQAGVKRALEKILLLLQSPNELAKFHLSTPRGLLLYGPAGMGKTLLAQAFAYEAGVGFVMLKGAQLFDTTLVAQAFQRAKEAAPAIVILDEIDTKGVVEGVVTSVPVEEIVRQIELSEGLLRPLFVIATAREKDEVPASLLAAGKIDLFVEVPPLDAEARRYFVEKILEAPHEEIKVERVVAYTSGMSGYDLERIGIVAGREAIGAKRDKISEAILIDAINMIKYGERIEQHRIKHFEADRRLTAWHEAAHAVLSVLLLPDVAIEQVTIAPRAEALGFVSYDQPDHIANIDKKEIENNLCVLLAGREIRLLLEGEHGLDSGASSDLAAATALAYQAVSRLGMDEVLGAVNIDAVVTVDHLFLRRKIEERVVVWLKEAQERTRMLVELHRPLIEKVALRLLEEEMLSGTELKAMIKEAL
ncbi:MAG: AAA family ATPase [Campylobacterales bacterium]